MSGPGLSMRPGPYAPCHLPAQLQSCLPTLRWQEPTCTIGLLPDTSYFSGRTPFTTHYCYYHYSTTTNILYLTYQHKTKAPEQPTNRPRLYHGQCYICGGFREEVLQGSCTPWHGHRYMIYHYIAVTSYLRLLARRRTARSRRACIPSCRRRDGCGADLSMEGMSIPFPYQRVVFCNFTMPFIALHSLLGTFCE